MEGLGTTVLVADQWTPARVPPLRRGFSHSQPQQSAWASSKESSGSRVMQHHTALHPSAPDREMLCGAQLPVERLRSLYQTGPGRVSHPRGSGHGDKGVAHPPSQLGPGECTPSSVLCSGLELLLDWRGPQSQAWAEASLGTTPGCLWLLGVTLDKSLTPVVQCPPPIVIRREKVQFVHEPNLRACSKCLKVKTKGANVEFSSCGLAC